MTNLAQIGVLVVSSSFVVVVTTPSTLAFVVRRRNELGHLERRFEN
jgi:hypothetical protein